MSRRYGRRQKQRHREEIARLKTELSASANAHAEERRRLVSELQRIEEHVREIAETIDGVVKFSALLPPRPTPLNEREEMPAKVRFRIAKRTLPWLGDRLREDEPGLIELDLHLLRASWRTTSTASSAWSTCSCPALNTGVTASRKRRGATSSGTADSRRSAE